MSIVDRILETRPEQSSHDPYACRACGGQFAVEHHACPDCGGFQLDRANWLPDADTDT